MPYLSTFSISRQEKGHLVQGTFLLLDEETLKNNMRTENTGTHDYFTLKKGWALFLLLMSDGKKIPRENLLWLNKIEHSVG